MKKTILLITSVVFSLLICECILRIFAPQDLSGTWLVDTESGLFVNKSSGSSRHQFGKRIVTYNFYHPHLRDTRLQDGVIRVLTVGDSFTFGWLLEKKDTYIFHLQEYADKEFGPNKFCFLNAGTAGWGTSDYVAFVEDYGELIQPDIVLVFLHNDDIGRSIRRKLFTLSSDTDLSLERHTLKKSYVKRFLISIPGYEWFLEHSHLLQLVRKIYIFLKHHNEVVPISERLSPSESKTFHKYARKFGAGLFLRLKKWCDTHGVALYVTTTGWHQPYEANNADEPTQIFMSKSQDFFTDVKIPFFDGSSRINEIKRVTNQDFQLQEGHPNEEGSRLIAETAWKSFLKQRLLEYIYTRSQR